MNRGSERTFSVIFVLVLLGVAHAGGAQTVQYNADGFESSSTSVRTATVP